MLRRRRGVAEHTMSRPTTQTYSGPQPVGPPSCMVSGESVTVLPLPEGQQYVVITPQCNVQSHGQNQEGAQHGS